MRSGITRQALRRHRWSLLGPACTQAVGAGVISMMIMTASSLSASRLTHDERQAVAAADLADAAEVFIGVSIYLSILIVGVTMNLAISQQLKDIALLRAIGATPGQVRRSVALQAAIVSVPASVLGFLAAVPAGFGWIAALKAHDVLPDAVRFTPHLTALAIALGIELVTSVVGASVAALRVARIPPTAALTETISGRPHVSKARIRVGLTLLICGILLSALLSRFAGDQAGDAAITVMLAECIGVGMIGPVILQNVASLLRPVLPHGIARLALDNIATMSRELSGTLIPLVLAIAFAGVKIASHTTSSYVTRTPTPAADLWTEYAGTAVYCAFAAVAALNALMTVLVGRGRDLAVMQLAGGTRRRLLGMIAGETLVVTATALALAAGVAGATLLPALHTNLGRWLPHLPAVVVAGGVLLTTAVVAVGMVAPAAVLTRRQPVQVVGAA